jgi:hypothetical protein
MGKKGKSHGFYVRFFAWVSTWLIEKIDSGKASCFASGKLFLTKRGYPKSW